MGQRYYPETVVKVLVIYTNTDGAANETYSDSWGAPLKELDMKNLPARGNCLRRMEIQYTFYVLWYYLVCLLTCFLYGAVQQCHCH